MNQYTFSDTKKHYEILDGLRGVASIMVIVFHIFEIFSGGDHTKQIVNHGYLAVDFFFLLSGFVIAHAYDDRWKTMSIGQFFKRRLIRLHPMILVGMLLGAICFYPSASVLFANVNNTPTSTLFFVFFLGALLIPVPLSLDIRGWTEMFPLNGPAWSLFYEYIANIMYALILRRFSTKTLAAFTIVASITLANHTINGKSGDIIGGWALTGEQISIALIRLSFPFLMGLLLARLFKPMSIKNGFFWCSILMIIFLAMPRIGGHEHHWMNGCYDAFTILFVFPAIIYIGASGHIVSDITTKICTFLGNISYPIYILHFPITYIFYAWVVNNNVKIEDATPYGIAVLILSIILSYIVFRFYDVPVRKYLTQRFLNKKGI